MNQFNKSRSLQKRAHDVIPGGCHTYAKGDDQFPYLTPGFIAKGKGSHVWDVDGNEYIEYGMGCRAVSLGHAFPPIVDAVRAELELGTNFTRPAAIELECAETMLHHLGRGDMCKFAKDGSTVTTTAIKLARAYTVETVLRFAAIIRFSRSMIGSSVLPTSTPAFLKSFAIFRSFFVTTIRKP